MSYYSAAHAAYGGNVTATRTPRRQEYEVIARVTRALKSAQSGEGGFPALAAAIDLNRRLWAVLASDVAETGNGLSEALRAQVLSLAGFADQHSSRVLAGDGSADVLIEINTAIMSGLGRGA
jgi:flagellar protein FlaF